MGKIKGWRKLKASNYGLSSWVANEGKDNETILALRRSKNNNQVKIVKKNKGSIEGTILFDKKFNYPQYAYDYAITYMESYPYGYKGGK